MRIVLPRDKDRISPVTDFAATFVMIDVDPDKAPVRRETLIANTDPVAKAGRIVGLGAKVLICGAISRTLEAMLTAAGIQVIPNTCGPLDEVAAAYLAGELTERAFLLPGCPGRRHRHRHRGGGRWRNGWRKL